MCAMDVKINQTRAGTTGGTQVSAGKKQVFGYLQSLKEELKKVTWTTQEELKFCTKIVIGSTFILGMGIYLADLIVKGCLDAIALIARWMLG
jgi:preprotein translocase subunit SecE